MLIKNKAMLIKKNVKKNENSDGDDFITNNVYDNNFYEENTNSYSKIYPNNNNNQYINTDTHSNVNTISNNANNLNNSTFNTKSNAYINITTNPNASQNLNKIEVGNDAMNFSTENKQSSLLNDNNDNNNNNNDNLIYNNTIYFNQKSFKTYKKPETENDQIILSKVIKSITQVSTIINAILNI